MKDTTTNDSNAIEADEAAEPGTTRGTPLTRVIGHITRALGSMPAIILAAVLVTSWLIGGLFVPRHFGNNSYQLLINTATTIITFLMVFIIQNVQNREGEATQVKLDAMISAIVAISEKMGIPTDDGGPLAELVGMEDEKEKEILKQQDKVRSASPTGSSSSSTPSDKKPATGTKAASARRSTPTRASAPTRKPAARKPPSKTGSSR